MRHPVPFRLALLALLTPALVGGCATEKTVQWGEETPTEQTGVVQTATTDAPLTAQEYATRFPTDGDCEAEARKIHERKPDLAVRLIKACVERGDFKRLTALTDAPWTPLLAADRDAATVAARVVAARAGDIEVDVKACAKVGYPVFTLDDLFNEADKARGRRAIFRARLDPDHKEKGRLRLIETALESGELETQPTGRRVSATLSAGLKLPPGDSVVLVKAGKVTDDAIAADGEFVALVEVESIFTPASAPTLN